MVHIHSGLKEAWTMKDEENTFLEDLPSQLKAHRGVCLFYSLYTNTVKLQLSGLFLIGHPLLSG